MTSIREDEARRPEAIIRGSPLLAAVLERWAHIALPDRWLVAGALAQTVWNNVFGLSVTHGISDIDLVYFMPEDLSAAAATCNSARLCDIFSDLPVWIDIKNQARVHLWYVAKFGNPIRSYVSTADASKTDHAGDLRGQGDAMDWSMAKTQGSLVGRRCSTRSRGFSVTANRPSGAEGYAEEAEALTKQYESIPFADVHRQVIHLIPSVPSQVTAVEPTAELRSRAKVLHSLACIEWLDDSLPDLVQLRERCDTFDVVMLTAVWMHLDALQRERAMTRVVPLVREGGVMILSLRHGRVPPGRRMFEVTADETVQLAQTNGLKRELTATTRITRLALSDRDACPAGIAGRLCWTTRSHR